MTRYTLLVSAALLAAVPAAAKVELSPSEAVKLLRADPDAAITTQAVWNGERTIFVDYPVENDATEERHLFIVRQEGSQLRAVKVAVAEPEGGPPEVAATGFANADRDVAKELIVILKWEQAHYDYGGQFWEVMIFDDMKPGQTELRPLPKVSAHFGLGCECSWRDGKTETYRFMTVPAVREELKRLGY